MWPPRTRCGCWTRIRGPPAARASWRDFEFYIEVVPDSLEIGNQGPLVPDIVEFLEFPDRRCDPGTPRTRLCRGQVDPDCRSPASPERPRYRTRSHAMTLVPLAVRGFASSIRNAFVG